MINKNGLTDVDTLVIIEEYMKMGIVPMFNEKLDVNKLLKDVDPIKARKMKRKFRKLWRKYAKELALTDGWSQKALGFSKNVVPTKKNKTARKTIVMSTVAYNSNKIVNQIKKSLEKKEEKTE